MKLIHFYDVQKRSVQRLKVAEILCELANLISDFTESVFVF